MNGNWINKKKTSFSIHKRVNVCLIDWLHCYHNHYNYLHLFLMMFVFLRINYLIIQTYFCPPIDQSINGQCNILIFKQFLINQSINFFSFEWWISLFLVFFTQLFYNQIGYLSYWLKLSSQVDNKIYEIDMHVYLHNLCINNIIHEKIAFAYLIDILGWLKFPYLYLYFIIVIFEK